MLKGVSKRIIEVNNPDSEYFEKAVLYLRSDRPLCDERQLRLEADRVISDCRLKKRGSPTARLLLLTALTAAAASGTAVYLLIAV